MDETTLDKWPEYFRLRESDIVINSTGTGTVGRVGYYSSETLNSKYPFMLPDSHVTVARMGKNILPRYIFYALRTSTIQSIMEATFRGSTNQKEFYIDSVYSIPIPLPPIEEQEEIVGILDDAFDQLRLIDDLQKKYSNDVEVLKSKIIDAGIRGKLTEQLPEDGTAEDLYQEIQEEKATLIKAGRVKKSKKLPDISAEEIPFEIPENWKWARLGDIFTLQAGKNITAANIHEKQDEVYPYPCYGGNGLRGFVKNYNVEGKHALIGRQGALCGNINMADDQFYATEHAVVVYQYANTDVEWAGIALRALNLNQYATSVAQPGLAVGRIEKVLIPLPPLEEQHRIVEKLDMVLSLTR